MSGSPFRVFFSYSHEDDKLRAGLEKHLSLLRREGAIESWTDHEIRPGQEWEKEIFAALEKADIVLLLVSASFIASDFCYSREMTCAVERHDAGSARVVPILLRPCDWKTAPFAKLQALPAGAKPVTDWRGQRDKAFLSVAEGIRGMLKGLRLKPAAAQQIFSVPFQRNRYFTGREEVLGRLAEQLKAGGRAAVGQVAAISGLGGIGKTQTAVEFAHRHRQDYRAVFFIVAETATDLIGGFAAMAEKLGLPEAGPDQAAAVEAALRWLAENEGWLLILDNADVPSLLEPYLRDVGRGHVLITSRAQDFAVLNLDSERLAPPPAEEARDFLLKRTRRQDAGGVERQAAAELAGLLGSLPLALEQAAAYVSTRQVSFADYLASYRRRGFELVGQMGPQAGTRHNSVTVTWSLNIEQVRRESPASADLLHAAAFLAPEAIPDEFFLDGGSEISDLLGAAVASRDPLAVAELAAPLLRYSLVERDAEKRTLSLHRLVQEAVKMDLGDAGSEKLACVVKALRRSFPRPEFATWLRCKRLLPHLFAITGVAEEGDELAWLLDAGAAYLWSRGRFAESEALCERSLEISEKSLGAEHPHVAASLNNFALLYADQGRFAEAEPLFKRSLAIWEKALGADHPEVASSLNNLANLFRNQGRLAEAEPLYERSLAIREKALGADHPDVAQSLNNLALLYADERRLADAEPLLERSLAIWEKALGGDHPDVMQSLNNLAILYRNQGRLADAEPLFERSLAIREKALGGDHPYVSQSLNNLAILRRDQGREAEAETLEARALEVRARHEAWNRRP
jgi:tetratricopeptide (TPR) repeat protein